ncbi:MAG: hypothetical protein HZA46_25120 [Planctomycetales bacterium]|nr:hypothetical protein [Planctomycetales bacterium]
MSRIDDFSRRLRDPNRIANRRWALWLGVWLLASCQTGCQIVTGVMLIFQGRPELKSDFERQTRKSLMEKDRQVLILCTASESVAREFSAVDLDLNAAISRRLKNENVRLVDPHVAAKWIESHGGEVEDLTEIATELKADYVVQIRLDEFSYSNPNSPGMYQGTTQAKIQVFEFSPAEGDSKTTTARRIYSTPFTLKYPERQPVPADRESATVFRKRFTSQVSDGIAKLFYDHRPDEDFTSLR